MPLINRWNGPTFFTEKTQRRDSLCPKAEFTIKLYTNVNRINIASSGETEVSYDPTIVRYVDLARQWQQRAKGCPDEEERTIFLAIATGYEQLASLSKNPDGAGEPVEEAV